MTQLLNILERYFMFKGIKCLRINLQKLKNQRVQKMKNLKLVLKNMMHESFVYAFSGIPLPVSGACQGFLVNPADSVSL